MAVKPTVPQALRRLRLDDDLAEDLADALDQAHAQAETFLDGKLYETEQAKVAAQDPRGIVATADITAAQLLLADVLVGANDAAAAERKKKAALDLLRPHRNVGC